MLISSFERGKLLQQCWKGITLKSNLSPFLTISSMKVSLVYFSSVHGNILIFLLQSFQYFSIEHQWGQLSSNHYVSLYLLSQLVPCFLVCLFCAFVFVFLVLISGDFRKPVSVFLILFRKISLPIKCLFWLKVSFIYFKSFLLSLYY